jgi:hypothetical protein
VLTRMSTLQCCNTLTSRHCPTLLCSTYSNQQTLTRPNTHGSCPFSTSGTSLLNGRPLIWPSVYQQALWSPASSSSGRLYSCSRLHVALLRASVRLYGSKGHPFRVADFILASCLSILARLLRSTHYTYFHDDSRTILHSPRTASSSGSFLLFQRRG